MRFARIAGALLAVVTAAGGLLGAATSAGASPLPAARPAAATTSAGAWVRDCVGDPLEVRPSSFVLSCADANTLFQDITWSSWGGRIATGKGTLVANTCTPDCAAGKYVSEPAQIALGALAERAGHLDYGYVWTRPDEPNRYRLLPLDGSLTYYGATSPNAEVWVRDCPGDHFGVAPADFVLTCADANTYLKDVTWTTWGGKVATGKGTLVENTCTPNCVSGKFVTEPAVVSLAGLGQRDGYSDYGHVWMSPLPPNPHHLLSFNSFLYYGSVG